MKRAVLMLLLAAMSTGTMAGWVRVSENNQAINYVDPSTIRKKGNLVRMWDMDDYKVPQVLDGVRYHSNKSRTEYDCAEEVLRYLISILYSGRMGEGGTVYSTGKASDWNPVVPGTLGEVQWKIACGKIKPK